MLVVLGFAMIATFMYLIMSKRVTPVAALILVPIVFGIVAGTGLDLNDAIMDAVSSVAPTAALLFFAIIFFGTMIDVGLFDPLIRWLLRIVKNDPVRIVMGTVLLTTLVSLDGDGSTTFIIVTSAFLPIYLRLGMSPVVLTVTAALSNGALNTVPWGGSTARAAAALHVDPIDIFVPMIPAIALTLVGVFGLAYLMGRAEEKRLGGSVTLRDGVLMERVPVSAGAVRSTAAAAGSGADAVDSFEDSPIRSDGTIVRPHARPKLVVPNLLLTLVVMTALVQGTLEPAVIFFAGVAVALVMNFPRVADQADQIKAHSDAIVGVVGMVFAATVLTGVLSGSGMVEAMADWLVGIIPDSLGSHLPVMTGLLSIPLTYFTSNDAFYFGVLPVLNETASAYGVSPVEMARASLVGQPLHQSSPIVASFLLLIGLVKVELGDHQRKALWRGIALGLLMLLAGGLTGAYVL
ncbi:MAG: citrate:proton symporter [Nocardioides sp.]|uniref:CitMHS family transporter n=1 Tax=Nocardioides sp. TaxID=35761 RepID=UPI0039E5E2E8